jgi:hypothetical protein
MKKNERTNERRKKGHIINRTSCFKVFGGLIDIV